jgi:hypothetical protein
MAREVIGIGSKFLFGLIPSRLGDKPRKELETLLKIDRE